MADIESKVYIGNLGNDGDETEISNVFRRYGKIKMVFVAKKPPGFAFVEFESRHDAENAVADLTDRILCGRRVRVELSSGKSRWPDGRPPTYLRRRPAPLFTNDPPSGTRNAPHLNYLPQQRCHRESRSPIRRRNDDSRLRRKSPTLYERSGRRQVHRGEEPLRVTGKRLRNEGDRGYRIRETSNESSGPEVIDSDPPIKEYAKRPLLY